MKSYVIALLVVVGVLAGFYGGYRVGHNNVSAGTTTQGPTSRAGNLGGQGGRQFGAACPSPGAPSPSPGARAVANGTITNLTQSTLTISNPSCEVKVVFGNTVQVSRNVAGSTSDLKDNLTVTIVGTRQADGSIKATAIQIGGGSSGFSNQATSQ